MAIHFGIDFGTQTAKSEKDRKHMEDVFTTIRSVQATIMKMNLTPAGHPNIKSGLDKLAAEFDRLARDVRANPMINSGHYLDKCMILKESAMEFPKHKDQITSSDNNTFRTFVHGFDDFVDSLRPEFAKFKMALPDRIFK